MSIRYQSAIGDGLAKDTVCSSERPAEAADLTEAERGAPRFADRFATKHLAIDDAVYDDLRASISARTSYPVEREFRCRVGARSL